MAENKEARLAHLPLGNASFNEVYQAFSDFTPSFQFGGHLRDDVPPFYKPGQSYLGRIIPEGNRVERSFSPTEYPYVRTALAYLALLTTGRAFGDNSSDPIPLATRTDQAFREQTNPRSFSGALNAGIFGMLENYFDRYPNLAPAMKSVFDTNAGLIGISFAINHEIYDLKLAIDGELTIDKVNDQLLKRPSFVANHQISRLKEEESQPVNYEVWCSGHAVANAISIEAQKAAITIASSTLAKDYDYQKDQQPYTLGILKSHTNQLIERAYHRFGK